MWVFVGNVEIIQASLKSDKCNGYCRWRPIYVYMIISLSVMLRRNNVSDEIVGNIKTRILYSVNFLFRKSCRL
jgi:hypothetical protein